MKKLFLLVFIAFHTLNLMAQYAMIGQHSETSFSESKKEKHKTKPIKYNSLGYQIPIDNNKDYVVGGNSLAYKRWGFCVTYRLGIKNFMMPEGERGFLNYNNVVSNNWVITGNTQHAVIGMMGGCIAIPITKKMPIYFGPGATLYREFFQYIDPWDKLPKWNVNPNKTGLEWNYTAGIFIPIAGRVLLNVEYNQNPQCIFVGIVITDRFCYEDADEW